MMIPQEAHERDGWET
jgi:hypothetical protein